MNLFKGNAYMQSINDIQIALIYNTVAKSKF